MRVGEIRVLAEDVWPESCTRWCVKAHMDTWLANLPPTSRQSRAALAVSAVLFVLLGIVAPFASEQLAQINSFIPSFAAIAFLTDLITSILLFSQFSISYAPALLALASGYLFSALTIVPYALTFPGAFSEAGLLGAGLQSTAWLYWFWHFGFPLAVLAYGLLKNESQTKRQRAFSPLSAIYLSVAFVVVLVCGLTLLATVGDSIMPRLAQDRVYINPWNHAVGVVALLVGVAAFAVLWARRSSVLDLWLMVVVVAVISELVLAVALVNARYSLGFYAGRIFSLVISTTVLAVLLTETTRLYARLAIANMRLQREQDNKLMSLEAMAASISHEVKQPLAAIAMHSGAASRFLQRTPPDFERVQSNLDAITRDSHRASQIFDDLRALYGRADQGQEPIDVNEIARGVLNILETELRDHGVITRVQLTPELPIVMGQRGQLQEVFLNLVRNAIDTMDNIKDGRRVLTLTTERQDRDGIVVAVEDSGPGIDPKRLDKIFEPFVTTKPHGMGLGLAICRMIIERHGGQLSAGSSEKKRGALFQFTLPIKSAAATR